MYRTRIVSLLSVAICSVSLTACEGTIYALRNAEATSSRQIAAFSDRVNPQPQQIKRPADSRYCYKQSGDVVCYRNPLPDADYRLVGYQEPLVTIDGTRSNPVATEPAVTYRDTAPISQVTYSTPSTAGRASSGASTTSSESVNVPSPPPVIGEDAGPDTTQPVRLIE